jgi:hypothetical protein
MFYVEERLGHPSIQITVDTYRHLKPQVRCPREFRLVELGEAPAAAGEGRARSEVGIVKGAHRAKLKSACGPQASGGAKWPRSAHRARAVSVGKQRGPTRTKLKKVSQTFASWNRIGRWLRQIDGLRSVA